MRPSVRQEMRLSVRVTMQALVCVSMANASLARGREEGVLGWRACGVTRRAGGRDWWSSSQAVLRLCSVPVGEKVSVDVMEEGQWEWRGSCRVAVVW